MREHVTEEEAAAFAWALLDAGARMDVRDDILKSTPLGWACRWGRAGVARVMLEAGRGSGRSRCRAMGAATGVGGKAGLRGNHRAPAKGPRLIWCAGIGGTEDPVSSPSVGCAVEAEWRRAFAGKLSAAPADRGIDSRPAGPDTPKKYGPVLSSSGLRYGRPGTTPETLAALRRLCAKKALLEGRNLPLLLKSPPEDSGAIGLLAAAWPGARFVVIQRHPLPTLESQVRAWRQLLVSENAYLALLDRGYRGLFADAGARIRYGCFCTLRRASAGWLIASAGAPGISVDLPDQAALSMSLPMPPSRHD